MVVDALRAYVQLASGLTEVTMERAKTAAKALVTQAGSLSEAPAESAAQVRAMADELMKTAKDNRDLVLGMVRTEVERAVGAMGVVAAEDFASLQRRLADLEGRLRGSGSGASNPPTGGTDAPADASPADDEAAASADAGPSAQPIPTDPEEARDAGSPVEAEEAREAGSPAAERQGDAPSTDAAEGGNDPSAANAGGDTAATTGDEVAPVKDAVVDDVGSGDSADSSTGPAVDGASGFPSTSASGFPSTSANDSADDSDSGSTSDSAKDDASAAAADFDIPTPIAVERVVAKKRAAERDWDDDELEKPPASADASDEAAQDPSPPDVSTA